MATQKETESAKRAGVRCSNNQPPDPPQCRDPLARAAMLHAAIPRDVATRGPSERKCNTICAAKATVCHFTTGDRAIFIPRTIYLKYLQ